MVLGGLWESLGAPWERPGSVLGAPRRPTKYGCPLCRVSGQLSRCKKSPEIAFLRFWEPNSDISKVSSMSTLQV